MFLCYCVAWSCDLDLWPFDLESVSCTVLLMSDPHTNFYYPTTIDYWVTSTEYLIRFPLSETVTAHAPCHVISKREQKNSPHFWNPWPQFAYLFCHSHGATTKIKPCYRRKIAFSHYQSYKVYCACTVSRDLCIGGPSKPDVTIFDPELPFRYTTFMGLLWRLRVVFILEHPHVKAIFGRKKTVQSKSVSKMAVFRKFKGLNIKYSYRDPQRAHPWPERLFTYFS